jgi:hypothetical protein
MLRVAATSVVLGFRDEDYMIKLLQKLPKVLPETEKTVRKFARFYIALRLAQAIAGKIVRTRIAKEAFKQALAARIGIEKIMPDDEYVMFIAANVFEVPQSKLRKILTVKEKKSSQPRVHRSSP